MTNDELRMAIAEWLKNWCPYHSKIAISSFSRFELRHSEFAILLARGFADGFGAGEWGYLVRIFFE